MYLIFPCTDSRRLQERRRQVVAVVASFLVGPRFEYIGHKRIGRPDLIAQTRRFVVVHFQQQVVHVGIFLDRGFVDDRAIAPTQSPTAATHFTLSIEEQQQ